MLAVNPDTGERRVVGIDDDGEWGWRAGGLPDLDDPGTLGCLLALVREAWSDDLELSRRIETVRGYGLRAAIDVVQRFKKGNMTEADAIVAALMFKSSAW